LRQRIIGGLFRVADKEASQGNRTSRLVRN